MVKILGRAFILHLFIMVASPLFGQSEWDYYLARGDSHEVGIFENIAYVTNRSGLLKIDMETKEETLIHPGNHTVEVQGFKEVEMLENGHMWLTSLRDGHLFYYDGSTFTPHCDSLKNVTNLVYADNRLWFFTSISPSVYQTPIFYQSDLYSFDGNNCINHGVLGIYGTTSDVDDRFWYVTEDSIKQFNGDSVLVSKALPSNIYVIQDYFIDSEDRQWIAYGTAPHLILYDNGNWEETYTNGFLEKFYELEAGQVSAVLRNNTYVEFIGSQDEEKEIFQNLPEDFSIIHMESTDTFWYITEQLFSSSRLFFNTPDTLVELIAYDDIIPATIVDLSEDCNGHLMASTRTFLYNLIGGEWDAVPLVTNSQSCYLTRFVKDDFSCGTWVGPAQISSSNPCKSVWQLQADSLVEYDILPHQKLYLYRDSENNILITSSNPAIIHKIDTLGNETMIPVPQSRAVTDIHFLDEDKMVVLSYIDSIDQRQSVRMLENNVWSELNLDTLGIADLSLGQSMYKDRNGSLWISEENGLIKYDGDLLFYHPFNYKVSSMVEDSYGTFWISTPDSGLVRWSPDSTMLYNTSNSEMLSNACRELQIIDEYLWVNHYYGLTKIKIEPIENTTKSIDVQHLKYKLYPNPSAGQITITNPLNEFRRIDVFTMDGIPVSSYTGSNPEWTPTLKTGVYIVKLKQADREVFEKVIVVN